MYVHIHVYSNLHVHVCMMCLPTAADLYCETQLLSYASQC